jgi:signal transduction histidine kinase
LDDGVVRVSVQDDGAGIPKERQGHVFEPFFTTKDIGKGTGLGLSTARQIVRQHRGEIHLESQPGLTRFTVRLPVSR